MRSIKCVVVGDCAVGKTSLLISYTTNTFPQDYIPAVFDNYSTTILVPGSNAADQQVCRLNLWDTAGREEYDRLRPLSYPQTDVFLVCFSVGEPTSLQNVVDKWWPEIVENTSGLAAARPGATHSPMLLVGTKADLRDDAAERRRLAALGADFVALEEIQAVVQQCGFLGYVECSALTQAGVHEVFERAAEPIVRAREQSELVQSRRAQELTGSRTGGSDPAGAAAAAAATAEDGQLLERPAAKARSHGGAAKDPASRRTRGRPDKGASGLLGKMRRKTKCLIL